MIERELLADIGFERGAKRGKYAWDHEVWHYDGLFWVHYGDYDRQQYSTDNHVDGDALSRKEFLRRFLEARENDIRESMQELTEDW